MSGGTPKDCLYHVWAFVRLAPGAPSLTEVCLACGVHYISWARGEFTKSDHHGHRPTLRAYRPTCPVSVTTIDGFGYDWNTPSKE